MPPSRALRYSGRVEDIAVFPVKSVAGLHPETLEVSASGVLGDRGHVLVDADGTVLTARVCPLLRELELLGTPDQPLVTAPGASAGDLAAVAGLLGLPPGSIALQVQSAGARQVAAVHLVTRAQRAIPGAGDSSRANLVVDFGAEEPAPESFPGAELVLGSPEARQDASPDASPDAGPVRLRLGQQPRHCAGVFAHVLTTGTVRLGDIAELVLHRR